MPSRRRILAPWLSLRPQRSICICISASQTLCRSIIAVISASTVCNLIFRYFSRMLRGCQAGFSVIIRFNSRLTLNVFNPCTRQASASVSAPAAAQPKQCMPRLDKKSCVSGYIFAISPIRSSLPTGPSSYSKSSISLFPLRRRRAAVFSKYTRKVIKSKRAIHLPLDDFLCISA